MLADILHKVAAMNAEDRSYYPRPSLSGPERCIRSLVYWGLNYPKELLPGRTYHIFDDGLFHEELIKDWIRKSAFQIHSDQMKVNCGAYHGITLKGSIDGIVTDPLKIDRLIEFKALNHFTFNRFWTDAEQPLDYFTQVAHYMAGVREVNPDITEGILLIKNKNTAQFIEYLLHYEPDTLTVVSRTNSQGETVDMHETHENICEDSFQKFAQVAGHIKKRTLPKRPYGMDHWRCQYCSYKATCWEGWADELAQMKAGDMLPDEIETMVRYYRELGGQRRDIEKEYKDLNHQIRDAMKDAGIREGRAGEYVCQLKLVEKPEAHMKASTYEQLSIKKAKEAP
jgi:hypothetical protein